MSEHLLVTRSNHCLTLSLNRPEKKNALTGAMYVALHQQLELARTDSSVRVVVLKGEGGIFTSGNDLLDFRRTLESGIAIAETSALRFMHALLGFPKPVVAAVEGMAIGIGATLLLHCDLVVAADNSRFHLPFLQLGLVPEYASSYLLPRLAGRAKASRYLMLCEPFDAHTAHELGLVSHVCKTAELATTTNAITDQLAASPAAALRASKALINNAEHKKMLAEVMQHELAAFTTGLASPEHAEAVKAFVEKRPADFSQFD